MAYITDDKGKVVYNLMPGQIYKCATCGHTIAENAKFCPGCRTPGPIARHPNSWRTSEPQWAIDEMLAGERSTQPVAVSRPAATPSSTYLATPTPVVSPISPPIVVIPNQKSSGLAAVLSFFWCGLGQIYNGQILKGVGLMIVYPVCLWVGWVFAFVGFLAAFGSRTPDEEAAAGGMSLVGITALILAAFMWLYGMINAYRRAEKINQKQLNRAF